MNYAYMKDFLKIFSGEKIFVAIMGVSFFLDLSQDLHL